MYSNTKTVGTNSRFVMIQREFNQQSEMVKKNLI